MPPEPFEHLPDALVVGGVGERMVAVGCRDLAAVEARPTRRFARAMVAPTLANLGGVAAILRPLH